MRQKQSTPSKLIILLMLMPISSIIALIVVVLVSMPIGLYFEDNYELLFSGSRAPWIIGASLTVGAVVPLVLLWQWIGDDSAKR